MTTVSEQLQVEAVLGRIRSLHLVLAAVLVCYVPAVFILYLMQLPELLIIAASSLLIILGLIIALIIGFARCPACNNYFHVRGASGNVFVRKCMNCGITL
ncbi:MAG: hypothetical protein EHM51_00870 [Geobacter sp.]|nr:MAG: hypothetical protein EHM51_00870 [Geobacter sp.]